MINVSTLAANMRNAFIERKGATIGGGKFTPEELRDGGVALKHYPIIVAALESALPALVMSHKHAAQCANASQEMWDLTAEALVSIRNALYEATGKTS